MHVPYMFFLEPIRFLKEKVTSMLSLNTGIVWELEKTYMGSALGTIWELYGNYMGTVKAHEMSPSPPPLPDHDHSAPKRPLAPSALLQRSQTLPGRSRAPVAGGLRARESRARCARELWARVAGWSHVLVAGARGIACRATFGARVRSW